ncbi:hypothetical protein ISN45_Aa01g027220 [Arabidopsis thaliana x Arabidopsis arenosa]|uniref:Reverse transcriptase zinc-binding domain-containing protein n=1 Tax=Arabidopsis thaliana x Arabidopsis arenosa TaxID=1240361 RepID=A0A8T2C1K9_9BRAS|nr:hypothetical protein ISN45_Aa01g027220 [Arabidopsis thaliana x Arabidopsis arenosa]
MHVSPLCCLCSSEVETRDHLLLSYVYSRAIWSMELTRLRLSPSPFQNWEVLMCWTGGRNHTSPSTLRKLVTQAIIYATWKQRNNMLHNSQVMLPACHGLFLEDRDRLQITTSLCKDGLIPSSESDPRSATDTQTPPELFCLTPKGLSNLSPARPSLKHVHLPQWNGPAEATRLSRTIPRKRVVTFSSTHQCARPRAWEESSRSYIVLSLWDNSYPYFESMTRHLALVFTDTSPLTISRPPNKATRLITGAGRKQHTTFLVLIPHVTGFSQKTMQRLTISILPDPAFLPSTISNWFRPTLGSSGDRLQITTSLCRDGLIPSSESDLRSATDT